MSIQNQRRGLAVLSALALAAVVAVRALVWPPPPEPELVVSSAPTAAPAPARTPAAIRHGRFVLEPGVYDLTHASRLEAISTRVTNSAATPRTAIAMDVQATLEIGSPRATARETWWPMRVAGAHLEDSTGGDARESDLDEPFLARVEPDGRVSEVRLPSSLTFGSRAILAGIAFGSQLARPVRLDRGERRAVDPDVGATWTASERDVNGGYTASYALAEPETLVKHYANESGAGGQTHETEVRYARDALRTVSVRSVQVGQAVTPAGSSSTVRFRVELSLDWRGPGGGDWASALEPASLSPFSVDDLEFAAPEGEPARPYATVLAEVEKAAGETDTAGRFTLTEDLTAAVAAERSAPAALALKLRRGELQGKAETVAISALVGAATDEAQAEVGALLTDEDADAALRGRLMQAATFLDTANAALLGQLLTIATAPDAPGWGSSAAMAAGNIARNLPEGREADRAEVVQTLVRGAEPVLQSEEGHATPVVRAQWAAALGNSGDPSALPLLVSALGTDPNPVVRAQAAYGLRFQAPKACIGAMVETMVRDPNVYVRIRLTEAARVMGPDVTEVLMEKALLLDESPSVRAAAAYAVASWSVTAPGFRKMLARAAKTETHDRVLEALKNYLEPGRVAGPVTVQPARMGEEL